MTYDRKELCEGVGLNAITDSKFKTSSISVRFILPISRETAAANALGFGILTYSNSSLDTMKKLNERLSSLYGGSLSGYSGKRGDFQLLTLNASWIDNRYAIDGEDITGGMLGVFLDCLFSPNASGGAFAEEYFNIVKKEQLSRIDNEMNEKRSYALKKAQQLACKGEPAEIPQFGTREDTEAVTAAQAYSAYRKVLETARTEIFYISPERDPEAERLIAERFRTISRSYKAADSYRTKSPVKDEFETLTETLDVLQCKMVRTWKTDSDDEIANIMLGRIFGGTPVSKLFLNVREKMSLCYYCAARFSWIKNILSVDSGVEKENIDKARDEIEHQLDEIRRGNISDGELEDAMLSIENDLTGIGDDPTSYVYWYLDRLLEGKIFAPEDRLKDYKNITKARIVQAANALRPDSEYIMLTPDSTENKEAD
ncbi:MAG: insulinase family protein [Ruminococcus sp.]|nr:insulinase family protein [Ruminococcus sp.]